MDGDQTTTQMRLISKHTPRSLSNTKRLTLQIQITILTYLQPNDIKQFAIQFENDNTCIRGKPVVETYFFNEIVECTYE